MMKHELSWSASRAREFERCRRENWYARYRAWNWWGEEPRGEKYQAMVLKQLDSIPAFAGSCVHAAIEKWFQHKKAGTDMSQEELFEEARELFREGWRQSSTDAWKTRPNKLTHLEEHHFGIEVSKERTDRVRQLFEVCADNFFKSPTLEPVRRAHPDSWRSVEALDSYQFLGVKVYAVPDFAYLDEDQTAHIWDWKTGRPRQEDDFQLLTYALYACEKWGIEPEKIRLYASYLATGDVKEIPITLERLSEAQDVMSNSLREMRDIHYDPDEDPAVLEDWPTTGAPEACNRCRFREICEGANGLADRQGESVQQSC